MSHSDDELQNRIEKGYAGDSLDEKAYQKIFEVLKQDPYRLPANFVDKVIIRIESRSSSLFKDYFWFGLGLLSFIAAAISVIVYYHFKFDFGPFKLISGYWGLIALGAVSIILIQLVDKQLIRNKMST